MFKLFERDKCQNIALNMGGAGLTTIVPGTILIMEAEGARKATSGDTLTMANAGLFYISNDYYNNILRASYGNTTDPVTAQVNVPSGMIAAIPIVENFEMVTTVPVDTNGQFVLLTITDGVFAIAETSDEVAFAMAMEDNNNVVTTYIKISTYMPVHLIA